nr:PREDICTED: riboflavin kinase-like isoform X1 [Equus przewalskii]
MRHLPYFCRGEVVRGFGRGAKELGIPTANFPEQVVDNLPADLSSGIYYGWASVGSGDVHRMMVSIGWNPYYKNTKKSMESTKIQSPEHSSLLHRFASVHPLPVCHVIPVSGTCGDSSAPTSASSSA